MWSYYNVNRAGETKSLLVVQLAVSTVLFAFGFSVGVTHSCGNLLQNER